MEQVDPILWSNTREWLRRTKEDLDAAALVVTVPSPLVRTAFVSLSASSRKGNEGVSYMA